MLFMEQVMRLFHILRDEHFTIWQRILKSFSPSQMPAIQISSRYMELNVTLRRCWCFSVTKKTTKREVNHEGLLSEFDCARRLLRTHDSGSHVFVDRALILRQSNSGLIYLRFRKQVTNATRMNFVVAYDVAGIVCCACWLIWISIALIVKILVSPPSRSFRR